MSISTEITRLELLRNRLCEKLSELGLVSQGSKLDKCVLEVERIQDRGSVNVSIGVGESYTIEAGYHRGGTVTASTGSSEYLLEAKTVTPTTRRQTIQSSDGYYGLSSVTVEAIPSSYAIVSGVTATAADVLSTKLFVNSSGATTPGTMINNGAVSGSITGTTSMTYTIPAGYHNGSGKVTLTNDIENALAAL